MKGGAAISIAAKKEQMALAACARFFLVLEKPFCAYDGCTLLNAAANVGRKEIVGGFDDMVQQNTMSLGHRGMSHSVAKSPKRFSKITNNKYNWGKIILR